MTEQIKKSFLVELVDMRDREAFEQHDLYGPALYIIGWVAKVGYTRCLCCHRKVGPHHRPDPAHVVIITDPSDDVIVGGGLICGTGCGEQSTNDIMAKVRPVIFFSRFHVEGAGTKASPESREPRTR